MIDARDWSEALESDTVQRSVGRLLVWLGLRSFVGDRPSS